jgi:hypothetical protein
MAALAACVGTELCSLIVIATLIARRGRWWRCSLVAVACVPIAGCDPTINVQGSFFPAWIICMAVGIVLTVTCRQLLAAAGLEPHLGPLILIYPSLWLLLTVLTWLIFYRT